MGAGRLPVGGRPAALRRVCRGEFVEESLRLGAPGLASVGLGALGLGEQRVQLADLAIFGADLVAEVRDVRGGSRGVRTEVRGCLFERARGAA